MYGDKSNCSENYLCNNAHIGLSGSFYGKSLYLLYLWRTLLDHIVYYHRLPYNFFV